VSSPDAARYAANTHERMRDLCPPVNRVPVERVRQLLAQGVTPAAICRRLAINKGSVSAIATQMRKESQGCTTTAST